MISDVDEVEYFFGEADCGNCDSGVAVVSPLERIIVDCEQCGRPIEIWMEEKINDE